MIEQQIVPRHAKPFELLLVLSQDLHEVLVIDVKQLSEFD